MTSDGKRMKRVVLVLTAYVAEGKGEHPPVFEDVKLDAMSMDTDQIAALLDLCREYYRTADPAL